MFILYPHLMYHRIQDIPAGLFAQHGITTLLLDIDNTLTHDNEPAPNPVVMEWLEQQQKAGMRLMLLSNNYEERVRLFAQRIGLEYIAEAKKPLSRNVKAALARLGVTIGETAIIGDQIFTDILCGRLAGCFTVLVEPMELENYGGYVIKRKLEIPVLKGYRKRLARQRAGGRQV